mmetsp:Transcript_21061/g.32105  ORF Transcript_21061/g.32105 Transcript_21061/m.32105 type:complete len:137 (-) Transcript_21061:568-978(-)
MASSHCIERNTTCFWCHLLLVVTLGRTVDTDAWILEFISLFETSLVTKEEGTDDEAAQCGTKRLRCRRTIEWKWRRSTCGEVVARVATYIKELSAAAASALIEGDLPEALETNSNLNEVIEVEEEEDEESGSESVL